MANGIEIRSNNIRVYFTYRGDLCREPLNLVDNKDNQQYAGRLVEQIRYEIKAGTFDYARYFPNSKRLEENKLKTWFDTWLKIKEQRVAYSTYRGYKNIVENHLKPKFSDKLPENIDRIMIEKWLTDDLSKLSSKSIKEIVALLKQIYSFIRTRHHHILDPTAGIKITMPDDEDSDPFTRDEIDKITSTEPHDKRYQERNLIQFMIWSGPRVSEAIALAWEDVIDLEKGLIKFKRARVRGNFKTTKTKRSTRVHELLAPARIALQKQWKITGELPPTPIEVKQRDNRTIKIEKIHFVFLNSNTEKPHYSDFTLRDRFFKAHLLKSEVRYRGPGQCRHTYISQMLTADMPIQWISAQTGTSAEMIRRRYGTWINADAKNMIDIAETRLGLKK